MTPERDRDIQEAAALDQFWDRLLAGESSRPAGVEPIEAATIRAFHAQIPQHDPDPSFVARLEAQLMDATPAGIGAASPFSVLSSVNGRAPQSLMASPRLTPALTPSRWFIAQAATAALLLLTLIGVFLAFGPGRPGRQAAAPAIMPAVSGTPATPEATDAAAEFVWQADGAPGLPFGELGQPAVDGQGNLWVADGDNSRFLLYAPDGAFREAWGTPGSGEGEFNFQALGGIGWGAAAFDGDGNIYVADTGNARIQKFGPDRRFIAAWGSEGREAGQFTRPVAIAIGRDGRVYVGDNGGKIEVFTGDGAWLATWPGLGTPVGLTIDGAGNIWLADYGKGVIEFSPDGEVLTAWDTFGMQDGKLYQPMGIGVDGQGRVFVSDRAERVQVFSPGGAFLAAWGETGFGPGQFNGPIGLVLDGQGGIYVTEDFGQRVQKFRLLPPFGP